MRAIPAQPGRILAAATAAGTITLALTSGVAVAAPRAKPLPCQASVSHAHPADYTTTDVRVHTADFARVTTVAHYRTTATKHHAKAGRKGNATIPYYISGATPGYTVKVSVSVVKGTRTGSCSTSFTPHR